MILYMAIVAMLLTICTNMEEQRNIMKMAELADVAKLTCSRIEQ